MNSIVEYWDETKHKKRGKISRILSGISTFIHFVDANSASNDDCKIAPGRAVHKKEGMRPFLKDPAILLTSSSKILLF